MSGSIDILEYCLQNGCKLCADLCTYAMHRHRHPKALDTLKWLRQQSCPWNHQTCYDAINHYNYDAFIWARNNGCEMDSKTLSLVMSSTSSSINLKEHSLANQNKNRLEETREKNDMICYEDQIPPWTCDSSSTIIERLRLLHKYGHQWDASVCEMAANITEGLRVLQLL